MTRPSARVPSGAPVLDRRALNRALLARQWLLERQSRSAADALDHLVGLQSQNPGDPYTALWSRLAGFRPVELSRLVTDRAVVRTPTLRTTIHLVAADDALRLRAFSRPVIERGFWTGSPFGRRVTGMDLERLLAAGRAFVETEPAPVSTIAAHLGGQWPDRDPVSMAYAIRSLVPLVQVPPRGTWGASHQATWTTTERWLGRSVPAATSAEDDAAVVRRYLAAFGPASVRDVQAWSWRTQLRPVVERLRPGLRVFRDASGRELFDLPEAPRPDPDTPAPPRFLPEFDNLLLSHADRTRVMEPAWRGRLWRRGAFLIDGSLAGAWVLRRERGSTTLVAEAFARMKRADEAALLAEADALVRFQTADADGNERDGGRLAIRLVRADGTEERRSVDASPSPSGVAIETSIPVTP